MRSMITRRRGECEKVERTGETYSATAQQRTSAVICLQQGAPDGSTPPPATQCDALEREVRARSGGECGVCAALRGLQEE